MGAGTNSARSAKELRAALHRAADLLVDLLEGDVAAARARRPAGAIKVDDVSRAFAQKALDRLGWPKGRAG